MATLHKKALILSYFSVGYNLVECLASLLAGYLAGSIALVGFGLDSLVESLSGGVMIWRFGQHQGLSAQEEARLEARAIRLVGYTFFVLAAYVIYESAKKLYFQEIPLPSLFGMLIALASLTIMPGLYYLKYRTGKSLNSRSLVADSKQTLACAFMSLALLIGLGLNYFLGLWQADPIIGLGVGALLLKEGFTALKEEKPCSCACGCVIQPLAADDDPAP
jgi:divalent metal cation (Fe/Co/Zn/Cd) transporter